MLDKEIIEQLKTHMTKLEREVILIINNKDHEKKTELIEMLNDVASTSELIKIKKEEIDEHPLHFVIQNTGVSFTGIPGGHEFSSLIIAILQSGGVRPKIDDNLLDIIKSYKEKMHFETVIALSCHNCPEVVQALNMMSIVNSNISHHMMDGEYFSEMIKEKKIQGVPTVFLNDELFHNGKIELSEIIEKLNQKYEQEVVEKHSDEIWDSVIIGGGPAGISSAIYITRKGLKTLMIADRVGGQMRDTNDIENMIGRVITTGHSLSDDMEKHLEHYGVTIKKNILVKEIKNNDQYKLIYLTSGEVLKARSVVISTGAKWRTLGVPGETGVSGIAFCVNCDGPFYRDRDVVVVGGGNSGIEAALDLVKIVKHVTVLEFMPTCKADQILIDRLIKNNNVKIITNAHIQEIQNQDGKVNGVIYRNRATNETKVISTEGVFIQIGLTPNSGFVKDLLKTNHFGEIVIDSRCQTNVEGIFAAGDVTDVPYKQIVISVGEGAKAGISVADYLKKK
jgi:NADH-dependent peroxiredoxin subunit F